MSLTQKTVKGIGWISLSQIVRQILQFIVSAILARLLFPKDFGLMAMVVVFSNFLNIFQGLGMSAAIIQKKDLEDKQVCSIFWIVIGSGFFLSILMIGISPLIASFYKQPQLTKLSIALGTTFFISSIGNVPLSLLKKEMRFKEVSLIGIITVLISGLVAILLALKGFGVWSLVCRQIFGVTLASSLYFVVKRWKPRFIFDWHKIKGMFSFGVNLTGSSFLNYFNRNLDNLLVGKFLGSISLGYYDFSYNIMLYPVTQISWVLGQIFFPVFSYIQDDLSRIRSIYTRATFYISVVSFPLMSGLLVLAPEFVRAIFGPKWINAIIIIRILSLLGLLQSIGTTVGWIYLSRGRTDIQFKWGIIVFVVVATGFIIGLHWGVVGVASAYAIAGFILLIPSFYIPFRLIDMNIWRFFKNFAFTFFVSISMGAVVAVVRYFMSRANWGDWSILLSCTAIGAAVYITVIWAFKREIFKEIKEYVRIGFAED